MKIPIAIIVTLILTSCVDNTTLPKIIRGDWYFLQAAEDDSQVSPSDLDSTEAFVRQLDMGCSKMEVTANCIILTNKLQHSDTFSYHVRNSASSIGILYLEQTGHSIDVSVF